MFVKLIVLQPFQNLFSRRFVHFEKFYAHSAKIVKLGLTPSNSYNFYASLRQELLDKMAKIGSHRGFEISYRASPGVAQGVVE